MTFQYIFNAFWNDFQDVFLGDLSSSGVPAAGAAEADLAKLRNGKAESRVVDKAKMADPGHAEPRSLLRLRKDLEEIKITSTTDRLDITYNT